eukprot:TRINITY_DN463_c0_g2_i4.p1 TRINITY_DN463_c0_g2~~TRINITY_DN463_c0_g2_i4.p1  ORF type:complete len:834 (-),score=313.83 TRINITY_DN463_c0_g2_i4:9-2510(-)
MMEWLEKESSVEMQKSPRSSGRVDPSPPIISQFLSKAAEVYLTFVDADETRPRGYSQEDFVPDSEFNRSLKTLELKKRWAKKEQEMRESDVKDVMPQSPVSGRKVEQIFTSNGASGVLTNDLLDIMHHQHHLGFSADPIDDNIYKWKVKMFNFEPDSQLEKDVKELELKFHYDFIEMEVTFALDLYPFYPPLVQLIRPRLLGNMMGRVTCMNHLKFSHWDPVKDMTWVLSRIRKLIQAKGRIDLESEFNFLNFQDGSYSQLEHLLLRLQLLTEIEPRSKVPGDFDENSVDVVSPIVSPTSSAPTTPTLSKKDKKDAQYWAKGTGYGHNQAQKWDTQAYLAAQKEKDTQTQTVIEEISKALEREQDASSYEIIESSCLIPVLDSYLRNDSLLDISRHSDLYFSIFKTIVGLASRDLYFGLLDDLPFQVTSIASHMTKLNAQAEGFLKHVKSEGDSPEFRISTEISNLNLKVQEVVNKYRQSKREISTKTFTENSPVQVETPDSGKEEVTEISPKSPEQDDSKLFERYKQFLGHLQVETPYSGKEEVTEISPKSPEQDDSKLFERYKQFLGHLQVENIDLTSNPAVKHHYIGELGSTVPREKIIRLAQEHGSLATSLPFNLSSSVFVVLDEDRIDFMKALITGPSDTPYDSGCFEFDIYFPTQYPNGPPLVNLETTGGGSVRFNPNLYNNGKVCLSLLGTWEGQDGESWNKETSTILQVLVSIQSLILVPQPYFNEPGYERQMGTKIGDTENRKYNETIRTATVEISMLGQLKNPSLGFEKVIRNHFAVKKEKILSVVESWLEQAKLNNSTSHYLRLKRAYDGLKVELDRIEPGD